MTIRRKTLLSILSFFFISTFLLILFFKISTTISHIPSKETFLKSLTNKSYHNYTEVVDRNDIILGYLSIENRIFLPYKKIPKQIITSFLYAEDQFFFKHNGFILSNIIKETWKKLFSSKIKTKPHTITQKLCEIYFQRNTKTSFSLLNNLILSIWLENTLSKEEILEHYINSVAITNNSIGIEAASRELFNKEVSQIGFGEILVLAALRENRSNESFKKKQVEILLKLKNNKKISKNDYEYWKRREIKTSSLTPKDSPFLSVIKREVASKLPLPVKKQRLKIVTSYDQNYQEQLENKLNLMKGKSNPEEKFSLILMDRLTGAIRSLKINSLKKSDQKYEIGSILIPIYISLALDFGFNLSHLVSYNPYTKRTKNKMDSSLYETLITNSPDEAIKLLLSLGVGIISEFTKKLKLKIAKHDLSLVNSFDKISLSDLAQTYGLIFNKGYKSKPYYIKNISSLKTKKILYKHIRTERSSFISEESAYIVENTLKDVHLDHKIIRNQNPSTVGLTPNQGLSWFVGVNNKLILVLLRENPSETEAVSIHETSKKLEILTRGLSLLDSLDLKEEDKFTSLVTKKISFGKSQIKKFPNKILPFKTKNEPQYKLKL